jgi:hypothetical protein
MEKNFIEGNQIHTIIYCVCEISVKKVTVPVSVPLRQKVTIPTVPVPQHCIICLEDPETVPVTWKWNREKI